MTGSGISGTAGGNTLGLEDREGQEVTGPKGHGKQGRAVGT